MEYLRFYTNYFQVFCTVAKDWMQSICIKFNYYATVQLRTIYIHRKTQLHHYFRNYVVQWKERVSSGVWKSMNQQFRRSSEFKVWFIFRWILIDIHLLLYLDIFKMLIIVQDFKFYFSGVICLMTFYGQIREDNIVSNSDRT